ncbi:hypothetical protein F5148DRAFT_1268461 [Russula earlei]|uniref:Uncharacterized protein n=1 Tax=Russula earlei TaxID=71964 RepID=A0ACC0TR41_9AGAM|nr:hypothetical protein F5148DRAFT_1268461 [Russula earlei]
MAQAATVSVPAHVDQAMVGELWPSAEPVYNMSTVGSVTRATCKMWRTVTRIFLCPGIFAFDGHASFVCVFVVSSASTGLLSCGFRSTQFSTCASMKNAFWKEWAAIHPASLTVASIVFCNIYEM